MLPQKQCCWKEPCSLKTKPTEAAQLNPEDIRTLLVTRKTKPKNRWSSSWMRFYFVMIFVTGLWAPDPQHILQFLSSLPLLSNKQFWLIKCSSQWGPAIYIVHRMPIKKNLLKWKYTLVLYSFRKTQVLLTKEKIDVGQSSSSLSPIPDKASATTQNKTWLLYVELSRVVERLLQRATLEETRMVYTKIGEEV